MQHTSQPRDADGMERDGSELGIYPKGKEGPCFSAAKLTPTASVPHGSVLLTVLLQSILRNPSPLKTGLATSQSAFFASAFNYLSLPAMP